MNTREEIFILVDKLKNNFIIFDGAMGTMLQEQGLKGGEIPETYNIEKSDIIYSIHKKYIDAGADVLTTNTFGANSYKLRNSKYSVNEIIQSAVRNAKKAALDKLVALDIGPIGMMLWPIGDLSFDEAYNIFKEQVIAGVNAGVDIILIETMSDLYETKAAVLAAKENSSLPVFCTMTFEKNKRTFTGTDTLTMVNVLEGLGVDALGLNCSLGPKEMQSVLDDVLKYSSIPVMIQPNAGIPKVVEGHTTFDFREKEFALEIQKMAKKGAVILGGCCGTTPSYIAEIKAKLSLLKPNRPVVNRLAASSSATKTVIIGQDIKIIGERINPTGKKKLKEAIRESNYDYIITEAISQKETGADILDINMGIPDIDEKEKMKRVIKELQGVVDLPLQIDSMKSEVIEAAVREYNGKPIINSVNGKKSSMEKILPIVKKYGALVIGLTLDEEGIPKTAEKRYEIAEKIINNAKTYGIPEENLIIDPLVLTVSAEQENVMETLKAITLIKSKYKVKTVLGVSNISFGLPNRKIINSTFLAMALSYGLDLAILDSNSEIMMDTVRAFKILINQDKECKEYINAYGGKKENENKAESLNNQNLSEIILKGLKDEAAEITKELLKQLESMEIVDNYIVPALDEVGKRYENQEIFLPQLIKSAETVKKSVDIIKEKLSVEGKKKISKGSIVLATVKGDIHDIGKNIVKLLLENYGFDIIDLGKDVSVEKIVDTVKEKNIKLVGLSALMTTTVISMEKTIKALKDLNKEIKVMVGGAVLTKEYANNIDADFYAKDGNEAVQIAKKYFGM